MKKGARTCALFSSPEGASDLLTQHSLHLADRGFASLVGSELRVLSALVRRDPADQRQIPALQLARLDLFGSSPRRSSAFPRLRDSGRSGADCSTVAARSAATDRNSGGGSGRALQPLQARLEITDLEPDRSGITIDLTLRNAAICNQTFEYINGLPGRECANCLRAWLSHHESSIVAPEERPHRVLCIPPSVSITEKAGTMARLLKSRIDIDATSLH